MASDTGSSSLLIVRAATAALLSFALLLPASAQFWGVHGADVRSNHSGRTIPMAALGVIADGTTGVINHGKGPPPTNRGNSTGNGPEKSRRTTPRITPTRRQPRRARMPR